MTHRCATPPSETRLLLALALAASVLTMLAAVGDLGGTLPYLLPVLAVLLPLLAGRYPGESLLLTRAEPTAPRLSRERPSVPRSPRIRLPRGGALLGAALAGRAPPLVSG